MHVLFTVQDIASRPVVPGDHIITQLLIIMYIRFTVIMMTDTFMTVKFSFLRFNRDNWILFIDTWYLTLNLLDLSQFSWCDLGRHTIEQSMRSCQWIIVFPGEGRDCFISILVFAQIHGENSPPTSRFTQAYVIYNSILYNGLEFIGLIYQYISKVTSHILYYMNKINIIYMYV